MIKKIFVSLAILTSPAILISLWKAWQAAISFAFNMDAIDAGFIAGLIVIFTIISVISYLTEGDYK